jgi:hypothetical protein
VAMMAAAMRSASGVLERRIAGAIGLGENIKGS